MRLTLGSCLVAAAVFITGCDGCGDTGNATGSGGAGGNSSGTANGSTGTNGAGGQGGDDIIVPQCTNLECQQVMCSGGGKTTVTGTVYDPSGTLPLYNVIVYVPNSEVGPIADGLSCDQCDGELSGSPLVTAVTDTEGRFVLENVPVGANIPLVLQVGKWRRIVTIPSVGECVDTPLTDANVTRLPRSKAEGNLPRIALTTGTADPLFCLLRRLGLDDNEYGISGSDARLHFFRGSATPAGQRYVDGFGASPAAIFPDARTTLWDSGWEDYDIVMMSCEASENAADKNGHRVKLRDYINHGGRVFATHYHYTWMRSNDVPADLGSVATFTSSQNNFNGLVNIDTTFPKGLALADWMEFVDGNSPHGQFFVNTGRAHTETLDQSLARIWTRHATTNRTVYFSFNAPIGAPEPDQCGRMVFSDIHVSASAGNASGNFPSACNDSALTEQEKALLFMLFDLSACIQPDDDPVIPPPN